MNASQFFIEYLIVGAFAIVTIAFAIAESFGLSVAIGRDVSAIETAAVALLLPTVGLAIDCIGKVMLWFIDTPAKALNAGCTAAIRALIKRLPANSRFAQVLGFLKSHSEDAPKPTISHAQMARLGPEVVRQSEMRKSRDRVSRGAFASSVICAFVFWLGAWNGADLRLHLTVSVVAALVFCGGWYRYRRRVRVYRELITDAFADVLSPNGPFHK
jgi:hypothetical protein